jgi:hypothetical protein
MRVGDIVRHKPSEQIWLIAKICDDGYLIPAGWPCSYEKISDCELVEACSDEAHYTMLKACSHLSDDDPRYISPESLENKS